MRFTQAFSSFVAGSRSFIINLQKRLISAPLKSLAAKLGKYVKWGGGGLNNGGDNWITFIGKNIDDLAEAPLGYQFYYYNGKKFLRQINASDLNTPRLGVINGKVVKYDGQTISNLSTTQVIDLANSSTKNPNS